MIAFVVWSSFIESLLPISVYSSRILVLRYDKSFYSSETDLAIVRSLLC
jgi:hypothetical protein